MIGTLLQTTIPSIPTPSAAVLGVVLLAFIGGMAVPTRYGLERLNGFGRAFASKLPYKAPPGMDAETAMQAAVSESEQEPDADGVEEGET